MPNAFEDLDLFSLIRAPGYGILWLFATSRGSQSAKVSQIGAWIVAILFWAVVIGILIAIGQL